MQFINVESTRFCSFAKSQQPRGRNFTKEMSINAE